MTPSTEIVVIGGGWYGAYHARQLLRALHAGKLDISRILVVDRDPDCRAFRELAGQSPVALVMADWSQFLRDYLATDPWDAHIVPAPFTPHLFFHWLAEALDQVPETRATLEPCHLNLGLPYEERGPDGQLYISYADWVCPVTCIEPEVCPAIGGPRDWDLADTLQAAVHDPSFGLTDALVFPCHHLAYGVGTVPARLLLEARDTLRDAARRGSPRRVAVGTVSHCHGVVGLLQVVTREGVEGIGDGGKKLSILQGPS